MHPAIHALNIDTTHRHNIASCGVDPGTERNGPLESSDATDNFSLSSTLTARPVSLQIPSTTGVATLARSVPQPIITRAFTRNSFDRDKDRTNLMVAIGGSGAYVPAACSSPAGGSGGGRTPFRSSIHQTASPRVQVTLDTSECIRCVLCLVGFRRGGERRRGGGQTQNCIPGHVWVQHTRGTVIVYVIFLPKMWPRHRTRGFKIGEILFFNCMR